MTRRKSRTAAFFDFDGTLIQGESGKYGFNFLREKGFKLPLPFMIKALFYYIQYKREKITEEEMSDVLLIFYKGHSVDEFRKHVPEFYEKYIKNDISPKIKERIDFHRRRGDILVIASASLCYFMEYVKEQLGFDDMLCTHLETDLNNVFTGRAVDGICIREKKKKCVLDFAREHDINLENSYGYGNHHTDIPFLEVVGHPVVVNPTKMLREYALEKGWEIL